MILKAPISAVLRTWVPPHSSREYSPSPISTIRTISPYFSPNSAIAPSRLASSSVVVIGRTGSLREIHSLTRSSTSRSSCALSAAAVAEVEAQLVGPDVGARLAHVGAEPLAQRRLQQVGGGVVALRGDALARTSTRASTASPGCSSPRSSTTLRAWSSPEAEDVLDARAAVAVLAFDRARRRRPALRRGRRRATRRA